MRDEVNKILSNYLVPITCLVMIMGVVVGLIKNWDAINDANSSGRRKEGLFNVGHIVMYAFIGIAIIGLIMTALGQLTMKI